MSKLPTDAKPKDVLKALIKLGFEVKRQTGSHVRLVHPDYRAVSVAIHTKPLPKGTLHSILRQAQLTPGELKKLL